MSDTISATHQYLLSQFGPLMTLKNLAEVMHSTPNGLRMAMVRKSEPLTVALADARRQVGRRLFFEASKVAAIIDQGEFAHCRSGSDGGD